MRKLVAKAYLFVLFAALQVFLIYDKTIFSTLLLAIEVICLALFLVILAVDELEK